MVPERRSSAKSRMVMSGMRRSRMTLMLEKSGRSTLSVTLRSRPIWGFMATWREARAKKSKMAKKK